MDPPTDLPLNGETIEKKKKKKKKQKKEKKKDERKEEIAGIRTRELEIVVNRKMRCWSRAVSSTFGHVAIAMMRACTHTPLSTALAAYSTWKTRPSGEKVVTLRSYPEPTPLMLPIGLEIASAS